MSQIITATYEHGALYPSAPLNLKEHQRVQVRIVPDSHQEEIDQVLHWLNKSGRLTLARQKSQEAPLSETERIQLSHTIGKATEKPLSEMILEDRGKGIHKK